MASLGFSVVNNGQQYVNNGQQRVPGKSRSKSRGGAPLSDQSLREGSGGTWQPALMPQLPDRIDRMDSEDIGRNTQDGACGEVEICFQGWEGKEHRGKSYHITSINYEKG
jgi:hypothetical protein